MAEAQDALLCIKNKVFIEDKNRFKIKRSTLKTDDELKIIYKDLPEALQKIIIIFLLDLVFKPKKMNQNSPKKKSKKYFSKR